MVKHHRYHQLKKCEGCKADEDDQHNHIGYICGHSCSYYNKRTKPKLLYFLLLSFISCCFILAPQLLTSSSSTFSFLYSFGAEDENLTDSISSSSSTTDINASFCSSVSNGTLCCDRSSIRTDVCIMKGDIRTDSFSSSVFLYKNGLSDYVPGVSDEDGEEIIRHEKIRPYTRKWEAGTMNRIDELNLIVKRGNLGNSRKCDVQHNVPAVFFSTGGYTGNVYHEFNDGLIPLYITSQHFNKEVIFVIVEYHDWWIMKYDNVLQHLTNYPAIDFNQDRRVHCFPEVIVGLRIHDELTIDPSLMEGNKSIRGFHNILDRGYWPRINGIIQEEKMNKSKTIPSIIKLGKRKREFKKPKLVILSRNGSRAIVNQDLLVKVAEDIGYNVEVMNPDPSTELAKIYRVLNESDVMIGVHGAAMTHFLFMKPGSVFIQVVPLGTDWAAETYYGEPAMKLGLKYISYKILPRESSLYDEYDRNDPVLMDPDSVNNKGWEYTKKIYLDGQNVRLNLVRFRKRLSRAYSYTMGKRSKHARHQSQ